MKRYNLHLKEEYRGKGAVKFPELTGRAALGFHGELYVLIGSLNEYTFSDEDGDCKSELTQQEIDELPHGFVKLFDLIEVEEELYYIKMPYARCKVLNEDSRYGEVRFTDRIETAYFKTKFTLDCIEEKYPELKQFAVKVEEIDNV